ncbi:hypothetical protein APY04_1053 [Hyphomicrobium sulfonivorans]|uniref:TIGR02001 family outer membrane protein n=2 Tax=Hyphomicrobium sulfonivorans TaxID=121290 RepID=A0A109BKA0_HYPSL|nr:hypothetical protein APY04_1053 [Hyphomicrobium sulfonivorans]
MGKYRRMSKLAGIAGASLMALSGAALADGYYGSVKDAPPPKPERELSFSATLTGTSDYVFRGVSQTNQEPTIQGSFDLSYGIFYAGVWGSGVDFGDDATTELDWYAGFKPVWNDFEFDFGVILYTYPGASGYDLIQVTELKAGVSKSFDKLGVGGVVYYSPDINGYEHVVVEGTLSYELPKLAMFTPTVSGLVGYQDDISGGTGLGDYTYWNAGLSLAVEKLTFDFRYWDTDLSNPAPLADERFVFSVGVSLP